jgi:phosphatidylserine synthase
MQKIDPPSLLKMFKIPDFITILSLFCGALGVYLILALDKIGLGMFAIFLSGLFDMIDGCVAIKLGLQRKFGEYLDFVVDTAVYIGFTPMVCYSVGVTQKWLLFAFILAGCVRHARQLAYPQIKRQGMSTTTAAIAIPLVFWGCHLTGLSVSLWTQLALFIITIGMLLPFPTTFYDRFKRKWLLLE